MMSGLALILVINAFRLHEEKKELPDDGKSNWLFGR